eukprot:scaffold116_cov334-Pavlova_lutheri.AAC.36
MGPLIDRGDGMGVDRVDPWVPPLPPSLCTGSPGGGVPTHAISQPTRTLGGGGGGGEARGGGSIRPCSFSCFGPCFEHDPTGRRV